MNFVLQKKIKDLNMKLQMKTLDEITKSSKININNNINNINIKLKTENNNIQDNKDDLIYNKFAYKKNKIQENDKLVETINILKAENLLLNKKLSFYSSKNNFIGVSFISENNETEEDKCFEEILDELDKNENQIYNKKSYYNTTNKFYNKNIKAFEIQKLKNSIDSLMSQFDYSQSAKGILGNILKQLGCSEEDIYKLIGNYRGVISIPIKNINIRNKK